MIEGIINLLKSVGEFFVTIFFDIQTFFKTIVLLPTIAPWLGTLVPTVFAHLLVLGIAFAIIKIIKDLL